MYLAHVTRSAALAAGATCGLPRGLSASSSTARWKTALITVVELECMLGVGVLGVVWRLRAHQLRRCRPLVQHQFGRQLSLLVRAAREGGGGYGGDGEEGRGDRTQGGNSTFSQQQSRRMQERVVESKIDGDSLESLSTEKINGQASVGAQYVHTYGIQYAAFHGIMAYLSVLLVLRLFYIMYVRTTYGSFAAITHVS